MTWLISSIILQGSPYYAIIKIWKNAWLGYLGYIPFLLFFLATQHSRQAGSPTRDQIWASTMGAEARIIIIFYFLFCIRI